MSNENQLTEAYRRAANNEYASDDLQIDDDAKISLVSSHDESEQIGAWVQAWVWVMRGDLDEAEEI
jgi:hypothetical protein